MRGKDCPDISPFLVQVGTGPRVRQHVNPLKKALMVNISFSLCLFLRFNLSRQRELRNQNEPPIKKIRKRIFDLPHSILQGIFYFIVIPAPVYSTPFKPATILIISRMR